MLSPRFLIPMAAVALFLTPARLVTAQSTDAVLTTNTFIRIAERTLPAVVSIEVTVPVSQSSSGQATPESMDEFLRRLLEEPGVPRFRMPDMDRFGYRGTGSGVVISEREGWAYVLTNRHVVGTNDTAQYKVTLDPSAATEPVTVEGDSVEWVGDDSLTDIAVLRFRVPDGLALRVIDFADSDAVAIGEWVLALGNPLELGNSVSQGIISAKNRSLNARNRIDNHLQTTAVINPGNSGGPLVNLDGKIVGINNAIATETGRWAGIGFAIPGNLARDAAEKLIADGRVSRGYLGIAMRDVVDINSSAYDLLLKEGVSIEEVRPSTPAELAGLRRGDVVVAVDERRIRNSQELLESIATRTAGDTIALTVTRHTGGEKQELRLEVALIERPSEQELATASPRETTPRGGNWPRLGPRLQGIGVKLAPATDGPRPGLLIEEVEEGTPAARAGLRPGDIVYQVNAFDVQSFAELRRALANVDAGADHVFVFEREGKQQTATVEQPRN